jgi:integrase
MRTLMNTKEMTTDELKVALPDRLRSREYRGKDGELERVVYWLDLRGKLWGELGTVVLHDPADPDWPEKGASTADEQIAKGWIARAYAQWVHDKLHGGDPNLKTKDAIEPFIEAMHEDPTLGPDHPSVMGKRSVLRVHVGPLLGKHRLATLPREAVQTAVNNLVVTKSTHGVKRVEPASRAMRDAFLTSVRQLFRHHYPGRKIPFAGVKIDTRRREAAVRREMIRQGRGHELIKKTFYTPDEIFLQLAAGRFIDLHPEYGQVADWACRIAAATIALQVAFASRISELVNVREQNVDEEDGFVLLAGTKSITALRFLPLQESVRPWLRLLREAKVGPARPDHYLLRMHPARDEAPNKDVFARRMGKVAALVGLKLPGQRSHIYRHTHSSWANMKGMQKHEIKLFLGHSGIFGGATDEYIHFIRQMTRPEHRTYIDLPSPEEIDDFLATGWEPANARKRRGGGAPVPE